MPASDNIVSDFDTRRPLALLAVALLAVAPLSWAFGTFDEDANASSSEQLLEPPSENGVWVLGGRVAVKQHRACCPSTQWRSARGPYYLGVGTIGYSLSFWNYSPGADHHTLGSSRGAGGAAGTSNAVSAAGAFSA